MYIFEFASQWCWHLALSGTLKLLCARSSGASILLSFYGPASVVVKAELYLRPIYYGMFLFHIADWRKEFAVCQSLSLPEFQMPIIKLGFCKDLK
jgi:hypothetical protein